MRKKIQATIATTSGLYSYALLFFASSFLGWVWEVLVCWWMNKASVSIAELILHYRGVLQGPWAPIYGSGVIALAIIWKLLKGKPLPVFLVSILTCGLLEYISGWLLEMLFHQRWWDYTGAFLNIDGYICFVSVFGFGIAGAAVMLLFMPRYLRFLKRWHSKMFKRVTWILTALFIVDISYSITSLIFK